MNSAPPKKSDLENLEEASFNRRLTKSELGRVWNYADSKDPHERFGAYRILEDYIDHKNCEVFMDRAKREVHWLPRSALYAAIIEVESPLAMTFLEEQFEKENNPTGKYVLAAMMRDVGNQKILEYCVNSKSKQARWIFARLEAQFMLERITLQQYQRALTRMLRNRSNWRFIERYLAGAGLPIPADDDWASGAPPAIADGSFVGA